MTYIESRMYDQLQELVRLNLIESYILCDEKKLRKAIAKCIEYYSTWNQWNEFKSNYITSNWEESVS